MARAEVSCSAPRSRLRVALGCRPSSPGWIMGTVLLHAPPRRNDARFRSARRAASAPPPQPGERRVEAPQRRQALPHVPCSAPQECSADAPDAGLRGLPSTRVATEALLPVRWGGVVGEQVRGRLPVVRPARRESPGHRRRPGHCPRRAAKYLSSPPIGSATPGRASRSAAMRDREGSGARALRGGNGPAFATGHWPVRRLLDSE